MAMCHLLGAPGNTTLRGYSIQCRHTCMHGPPWALVGRALVGPLGPCGPGPCGPPWALVGRALVGPPGPLWAGPLWPPWALTGRALMGSTVPSWAGP